MDGKLIFGIIANIIGIYIIYKIFFAPVKVDIEHLYKDLIEQMKESLVNAKIKLSNNEIIIDGENNTSTIQLQIIHKSKRIFVFVSSWNEIHGQINLKLDFSHEFNKTEIYGIVESELRKEMISKLSRVY